eukprot:jgi/Ulvmu1/5550/UM023_0086.1
MAVRVQTAQQLTDAVDYGEADILISSHIDFSRTTQDHAQPSLLVALPQLLKTSRGTRRIRGDCPGNPPADLTPKLPPGINSERPSGACIIYVAASFLSIHAETIWLDSLVIVHGLAQGPTAQSSHIVSLLRGSLFMTNSRVIGMPGSADQEQQLMRAFQIEANATNAYFQNVTAVNMTSGIAPIYAAAPTVFDSCVLSGRPLLDIFRPTPQARRGVAPAVVLVHDTDLLLRSTQTKPEFSWNDVVLRRDGRVFADAPLRVVTGGYEERQQEAVAAAGPVLTGMAADPDFAALQAAPWDFGSSASRPAALLPVPAAPGAGGGGGQEDTYLAVIIALAIAAALMLCALATLCWRRRRLGHGIPDAMREIDMTGLRGTGSTSHRKRSTSERSMLASVGVGRGLNTTPAESHPHTPPSDSSKRAEPPAVYVDGIARSDSSTQTKDAELKSIAGRAPTDFSTRAPEHLTVYRDGEGVYVHQDVYVVDMRPNEPLPPTYRSVTAPTAGETGGGSRWGPTASVANQLGTDGHNDAAGADAAGALQVPPPQPGIAPAPSAAAPGGNSGEPAAAAAEAPAAPEAPKPRAVDVVLEELERLPPGLKFGLHGYVFECKKHTVRKGGQGVVAFVPKAVEPSVEVDGYRALKIFSSINSYRDERQLYRNESIKPFMPAMIESGEHEHGQAVRTVEQEQVGVAAGPAVQQEEERLVGEDGGTDGVYAVLRRPFIVMEGGSTLSDCAGQLGNKPIHVFKMLQEVAACLGKVHTNGWVHRDIKPDNVLRVKRGAEMEWKLIDFGLARKVGSQHHAAYTRAFAAPEVLRAAAAHVQMTVDAALDAWALGVTAYIVLSLYTDVFPNNAQAFLRAPEAEQRKMILGEDGLLLPWEEPAVTGVAGGRHSDIRVLVLGWLQRNPSARRPVTALVM